MILHITRKVIHGFICSMPVLLFVYLMIGGMAHANNKHIDNVHTVSVVSADTVSADTGTKQLQIENLRKIANNKNPKALYALGKLYEPNYKKSYPLILRSANLGYAKAESLVAFYYLKGLGVHRDRKKALRYLNLASKKHDPTANIGLAIISIDKQEYAKAIKLLTIKPLAQNPTALEILGELYLKNKSLNNNVKYGIEYFTRSALLFNTNAIYFLALNYSRGDYTPINYQRATAWAAVLYDFGDKKKATAILQQSFKHMTKKDVQISQIFSNRIIKEMHKLSQEKH